MNSIQHLKAAQLVIGAILAALLLYVVFRGYLGPESLIGFANLFVC
jgi:hypothetical protein